VSVRLLVQAACEPRAAQMRSEEVSAAGSGRQRCGGCAAGARGPLLLHSRTPAVRLVATKWSCRAAVTPHVCGLFSAAFAL